MRQTKNDRGDDHANPDVAQERRELPLEVSAEDDLFAKTGRGAEQNPEEKLSGRTRTDGSQEALCLINSRRICETDQMCESKQNSQRDCPKADSNHEVEKNRFKRGPAANDQVFESEVGESGSNPDQAQQ